MAVISEANTYNVETSINDWFVTALAEITRPVVLAGYSVVFNMPETAIVTPAFAVTHRGVGVNMALQGRNVGSGDKGGRAGGLMLIDCYVSRSAVNWNAYLGAMASMVQSVFVGTSGIVVYNYMDDPDFPVPTPYKVDFTELEAIEVAADPNPDIERRRFNVRYNWTVRS